MSLISVWFVNQMANKLISQKYLWYIVGVTAVTTATFLDINLKNNHNYLSVSVIQNSSPWAAMLEE